ncbi:hypothetical protein P170DRAFT_350588 [Aspergillus steynii IBT 23096]|uniref:Uncharacterized protein n=1 Tax=Aspergillus steynii IBT 23096 TaxID=1392250 RepID=A0A2I2GI15_9EURO|nr:uncharacterized protein P170DRAFT_350588 [Aspergillus steynii IBT 23096]PLB52519.1 hypothetical protein P170DRAFT_350588 [Aspergillus steynii IBT 23096]
MTTLLPFLLSLPFLPITSTTPTSTLNIAAHQDDTILFQSPSLIRSLHFLTTNTTAQSPKSPRHLTIFLTAGDAGNTSTYWLSRESGIRASYATMLSAPNTWIESSTDAEVPGHSVAMFTLSTYPVSLAFLRLPDGFLDGRGFERTGNRSLRRLWDGEVQSLQALAVDGLGEDGGREGGGKGEVYTNETVVSVLGGLVRAFKPEVVSLQNYKSGEGDHSDHFYGARFAREAVRWAFPDYDSGSGSGEGGVKVIGYVGYPVIERPENVRGEELEEKNAAFYAYAKHDWMTCESDEDCVGKYEVRWLTREYTI